MKNNLRNEYFPSPDEFPDEKRHLEAVQAERAALGCIFLNPPQAEEMLPKIPAYYFSDLRHKEIRWGLEQLALDAKPPDVILLVQLLRNHEKLEKAGGHSYISELPDVPPASDNFPHYTRILSQKANARLLNDLGERIKSIAQSGQLERSSVEDARYMVEQLLNRADTDARSKLTLRRPSEILAMKFDDRTSILGNRFFCKGQSLVIAGAGGVGKSRLLYQIIAAIITQRKCLTWETGNPNLKWLVLQTENANQRVQEDLLRIKAWLTPEELELFDKQVIIHTLENDSDGFVSLDQPQNCAAVADAVEESQADIVCLDPLNDFGIGDINKDVDMRATVTTAAKLIRKGNHERSITVLHHAITGKAGASKAVGYDRSSFARNSKALYAWTRAQINLAAVDEENNDRLVIACGKCSNAREFMPFAVRLESSTMLYECDPSVDIKAWQNELSGKEPPLMTAEGVRNLCRPLTEKSELARLIANKTGCAKQNAYRYIRRAELKQTITVSKDDLCSPK